MSDDKTQSHDDAAVAEELKGVPEDLLDKDGDDVASLREQLEASKQEVLYARAETQNVRRRLEKDIADTRAYAELIVRSLIARPGMEDWRGWRLIVKDDVGTEIFDLPFASVLGKPH